MTPSIDPATLQRYLERRSSPDETAAIAQWLDTNPERAMVVGELRHDCGGGSVDEIEQVWTIVQRRMVQSESSMVSPRRILVGRGWARSGSWAGRLVLVACCVGGLLIGLTRIAPSSQAKRTFTTATMQRGRVLLPNGIQITLAPQTTLQIQGSETVRLTGEAYFQLSHHVRTPFVVQTGQVTTRVLGTAFDVRRYPGDTNVRVVVTDGKVQSGSVVLSAGMLGQFTDSSSSVQHIEDTREYSQWMVGPLNFRDVPVTELLSVVGHWYGYQFRLSDTTSALAHEPVTARLDYPSARDMFTALQSLLNVTLTFDGRVVTLHPQSVLMPSRLRRRDLMFDSTLHSEVGR